MTTINVNYPTEHKVYNQWSKRFDIKQVNVRETVAVRNESGLTNIEKLCLQQTGMLPVAYQAKFNMAWNA